MSLEETKLKNGGSVIGQKGRMFLKWRKGIHIQKTKYVLCHLLQVKLVFKLWKPNWFSNHELKQLQAKLVFGLWT